MIKCLQVNLGRGRQAQDLLLHKLLESNTDVAIISEQYKSPDSLVWYEDKTKQAAILVMNSKSNISEVNENNVGFVYATINSIRIYSCYFPPSLNLEQFIELIRKLESSIRTARCKVIIGGDFNSKSPEWGSKTLDKRGECVSEMIASLGLVTFNMGSNPTFIGSRGKNSIIDITFGSTELLNDITDWKVLEELTLSDHQYIAYSLDKRYCVQTENMKLPKWNVRKLSTDKLVNYLQMAKRRTNLENDVTECGVKITTDILTKCCNVCMPKKKLYKQKRKPAFWWTPEIAQLRRECLHARRIATRHHNDENLTNNFRKLRKMLRKAIKKSKKQNWRALCNTLDTDPWGKPYQIVTKKMSANKPIPGIKEPMWAAEIVATLFPVDMQGLEPKVKLPTTCEIAPFTYEELKTECYKLKLKKSPGPDGIPNEIIKLTQQFWPELLLKVYNNCLKKAIFPKRWKKQNLVLLRKGTKPLDKPNSYRPLCMINTLGKLYESLLLSRLEEEINSKGGLSPRQYGFRKGKSTVDAIKEVTDYALSAKEAKCFCIITTLDVKNAFNSVRWEQVLHSLRSKGVSNYLYNVIVDYLSERYLLYQTEDGTREYKISAGVPQGSVLGPFLWNVMYDGLLNMSLPSGAHLIGYADDIALVTIHNLPQALEIITNDSLYRCDRWIREHGLSLAAEKTEAILVTNRRIFEMPKIRIQNQNVSFGKSLKYLGIQLDSQLNFKIHLRAIRDKTLNTANTLAKIMPNKGGPKESTRRLINSVIHSQILYAAPILIDALKIKNNTALLLKPQRMSALRIIAGYRTISTSASLVLAGIPPADLLIFERAEIWRRLRIQPHTENVDSIKKEAREMVLNKWQERWASDTKGRWTHRLIPNIKNWVTRNHGETNYYLTQIMTGHGNFNSYLKRFKITDDSTCKDCGSPEDNAEHVLFYCNRWHNRRRNLYEAIGVALTPENITTEMQKSERSWKLCQDFIIKIMTNRNNQNTEPLISNEDGGVGLDS